MTNLDDLRAAWQSQSGISEERFAELGAKVHGSSDLLQSVVFRRDMIETVASVVVVFAFSFFMLSAKNWLDWSGCAIVAASAFTIPFVLWWARKRLIASVSAANFRDFVDVEIDYLRRQVRLLRLVGWIYLLPFYVGISLLMVGMVLPRAGVPELIVLVICLAICALVYFYIWWLNQSARKKGLEPLLDYYVDMQAAIENDDGTDLQLPDPPSEFLQTSQTRPLSRQAKWIWGIVIVSAAMSVAIGGFVVRQNFDARTGGFILSTTPVVAILFIVMSGIWRRGERE